MHNAEKLIGIEFNDKQEDMALPGVNRALDSYEVVRKIDVPLDTEPAIVFHPALPGFHVKRASAKTKFKFGKNEPGAVQVSRRPRLCDRAATRRV